MMQKYDVKIRKANENDIDNVLSILLRLKRFNSEFDCFCRVSEKDMEEIRNYVKKIINDSEGHIILIAEDRDKTVGILIADILYRIYYNPKHEARMRDLYVMPEYRQKGIASDMIRELKNMASEKDVGLISAEFPASNPIAQIFYKQIGYLRLVSIYGKPVTE